MWIRRCEKDDIGKWAEVCGLEVSRELRARTREGNKGVSRTSSLLFTVFQKRK